MRMEDTYLYQKAVADLRYNIATGLLVGRIDGTSINAQAGSGGRSGTKTRGALNWWLANNPFATGVGLPSNKSHPGGPIPMGVYRVVPHEQYADRLRLNPIHPSRMHGRFGMLIHGRGKRGSDGCIVPTDFANVQLLCKLVAARRERGGADVLLQVFIEGQDLEQKKNTA